MADFPLTLDDYTLTINGSATETKIIFHSGHQAGAARSSSTRAVMELRGLAIFGTLARLRTSRCTLRTWERPRTRGRFNVSLLTDQERPVWNHVVQASVPREVAG